MMTFGLRPAAFGPGDLGHAAQDSAIDQARRVVVAPENPAPPAGGPQTSAAVRQPDSASDAAPVDSRRMAETQANAPRVDDSRAGNRSLPPELIAPQPPAEAGDGVPEGIAFRPEPAGPLKTYAQIPMEIVREITRLREEAAEAQAAGISGRNDPTPMPARPDAIGARMPYDAA
ncbi:hypothetical protein DLJ49_15320 [Rhodovulum sp. 12E13]|uniref:hypothetical protein n=1 Tax=Rhodovulum sp. 12E13 TaxID=2203891 RepID=UPI000E1493DD|nr:hypothetical protein [Rhodovulum sp. 12E13]RDC71204.1 hypothetical protein DLJ49_15320 [Rhodovulum sp. 12E13]